MDDMTQLLTLADAGAFAPDVARFDPAGLAPVEPASLPFVPVGPILTTPALAGSLVAAVMERREGEARRALIKAEALGDPESVAWLKGLTKALVRAQDYLSRAMHAGSVVAAQTYGGPWVVVGSKGDRYRVERRGMELLCDCPHGLREQAGQAAAGRCYHRVLIEAIEEAQDERDGLFDRAA